jgi:hypothetical protein
MIQMHSPRKETPMSTNTFGRSLHVLLLALIGLTVYVVAFALVVGLCALVLSAYVHAQQPAATATGISMGQPAQARSGHAATTLPNGKKILVDGSSDTATRSTRNCERTP